VPLSLATMVPPLARHMTPMAGLASLPFPPLGRSSWLGLRREA